MRRNEVEVSSVSDSHHSDAEPDPEPDSTFYSNTDPDPTFQLDADPDPTTRFLQIWVLQCSKMISKASNFSLWSDPDTEPAFHFVADQDSDPAFHFD